MLPSREGDGYGLSKNAIQSIHDKGCQPHRHGGQRHLCRGGSRHLRPRLGMDLIITDHHLPHDTLPKAVAVVDPRRADDHSPFKGLCGAGVAFKLCAALDGCPPEEMLDYCGDLAAVGTVADVMPLTGGEPYPRQSRACGSCNRPTAPALGPFWKKSALRASPSPPRTSATPSRPASMRRAGWTTPSPLCSWCSVRTRTGPRNWRIS